MAVKVDCLLLTCPQSTQGSSHDEMGAACQHMLHSRGFNPSVRSAPYPTQYKAHFGRERSPGADAGEVCQPWRQPRAEAFCRSDRCAKLVLLLRCLSWPLHSNGIIAAAEAEAGLAEVLEDMRDQDTYAYILVIPGRVVPARQTHLPLFGLKGSLVLLW